MSKSVGMWRVPMNFYRVSCGSIARRASTLHQRTLHLQSQSFLIRHKQPFSPVIHSNPLLRSLSVSPQLLEKKKEEEKVGIGKKFKQMFKDYWYVLVPVHVATSLVWYGGFYLMCKSGIDVGAILQAFGASEAYVEKLSQSEAGYLALAYACYKIATPARYTVTVGGTTMTVKYLSDRGYLKTSHQMAENMKEKADTIAQDVKEFKEDIRDKADHFKDDIKDKADHLKEEMKERRDKARDEWAEAWRKYAQKKRK